MFGVAKHCEITDRVAVVVAGDKIILSADAKLLADRAAVAFGDVPLICRVVKHRKVGLSVVIVVHRDAEFINRRRGFSGRLTTRSPLC